MVWNKLKIFRSQFFSFFPFLFWCFASLIVVTVNCSYPTFSFLSFIATFRYPHCLSIHFFLIITIFLCHSSHRHFRTYLYLYRFWHQMLVTCVTWARFSMFSDLELIETIPISSCVKTVKVSDICLQISFLAFGVNLMSVLMYLLFFSNQNLCIVAYKYLVTCCYTHL